MTQLENLKANYMDKWGLISPYFVKDHEANFHSGNSIFYSAFYWEVCKDEQWLEKIRKVIERCKVSPGVYRRAVSHPDVCSFDDWIGLAILSPEAGLDILENNKKTWLQPQIRCHINFCAGRNPGIFYRFFWKLSIWWGSRDPISNQDSYSRAYLLCKAAEGKGVDQAIQRWKETYKKKCEEAGLDPNGIFARCVEPGHPLGDMVKF